MDVFACPHCQAVPEPIADSAMVTVRHKAGCEVLLAQTRARWPLTDAGLPVTPGPVAFEQRAAFGRWHRTVQARQVRRERRGAA